MEALGAAVNILSAIDLSAKVGLLCLEYAKAVKNAQTEIAQLHREAVELEKGLTDMQSLLEGADKEKLKSSQRLNGALKDSVMQLQMLEKRLHPSTSRKAMSRIGLRALKWPFESKEIDPFITNLRKNKDIISLTLQVDQTALLLEVNSTLSSLDQKWLEGNTNLAQLLQDAMRLTLANLPIIDSHPLQLYSSVLAFAPKNSIIRQLFQHYMLELFSLVPETQDDWDGCLQVLEGHDNWVTCVSFSENSKILASGSNDRTVRLWLADSGQCLWELHGHERPIVSVTFSQDSKLLASVSEDGDAQLWSVDSGKCIKELNRYDDWVTSVAFSFGSRLIVSTRQDQTIRLWETGNEGSSQVYKGHEGWVENVVLSPQSGLAASYSDNIVHVWRIANGQLLRDLRGHTDRVTLVSFSRDSTLLASSSYDKTVRVWRVDNGDCVQILRYKATVKALTFFPSSRLLVTAIYSEIQVWDIATGECIQELSGHRDWVTHVAFSPDSKLMASASEDETVRLWQVGDDERIRNKNSSDGSILAWTVSTNRALIASVSNDHVQLWRTDNGECTQKLKGHDDSILSVTFSPNTRFLASSSYDGTVRLWKVDTGECLQTLEGHVRFATSMAFSADSKRLATSSWEEFIRLWDVSSGISAHLNEQEKYIAVSRLRANNSGVRNTQFKGAQVLETYMDIKSWLLVLISIGINTVTAVSTTFIPLIISLDFGFSGLNALLLTMPVVVVGLFATIGSSWVVQHLSYRNIRVWSLCISLLICMFMSLLIWQVPHMVAGAKLFVIYLHSFQSGAYAVLMSLTINNCAGYTKRSSMSAGLFVGY
ncbi:hypothetical protein RAB80_012935 [Fusarium oxysporum f. sp. vasinfectum]|nr:hypothetical protein RAB80_012935 [Fusarium oxysporum f. sp. vasinfectum]